MEIWKIRQKSTGLFSVGGDLRPGWECWAETGKNWSKLGHLKNHLNIAADFYRQHQDDIEVVKMVLVASEKDTIPMKKLLDDREKRHREKQIKIDAARKERRLAELEREKERITRELKELNR